MTSLQVGLVATTGSGPPQLGRPLLTLNALQDGFVTTTSSYRATGAFSGLLQVETKPNRWTDNSRIDGPTLDEQTTSHIDGQKREKCDLFAGRVRDDDEQLPPDWSLFRSAASREDRGTPSPLNSG